MSRMLFFLLLAVAVYLGYRWWLRARSEAQRRAMNPMQLGEAMVRCEVCGVNLPQSDALPGPEAADGAPRWYCGEAHRAQSDRS
ncbi:MAG: PP0621 family protein [Betaproteobacteria bacterium]